MENSGQKLLQKYRVLILDDDFELGELIREYLQVIRNCSVKYISTENDLWSCLKEEKFDILFLDYMLPGTSGLDILVQINTRGFFIPTVMMTGEGNENIAVRAIQSGALDYLVKGEFPLTILPSLIEKAVRQREVHTALQQYMEQNRLQALLLNNMRDAVVVWELDGTITYWNAAAEKLYRASSEERIAKKVDEVFFPQFDPQFDLREFHEPVSVQIEHRYLIPNGQTIWVSSQITTLYHPNSPGTPVGMMNVSRDISVLKMEQESLIAAQTHLAQTARMASIGELASGVAHQISNPLTTIIADAQILTRDLGKEHPGLESAEAIMQAGWRAQAVINELMKFSQPSRAELEPVSINSTVESALLLTSAYIQASGINLDVQQAEDLPQIIANPRQLSDLWVNLLLLARSAIKDKAVHTIRIETSLNQRGEVEICFTDDGIPIPPEQYKRIFEPQLIPSGSGRGTGIELSICHEIVRQNNARIFITSSGLETTFHITFLPRG
jgi:two-component system, cell cycle sensor histidine kinase and response regulator CckA